MTTDRLDAPSDVELTEGETETPKEEPQYTQTQLDEAERKGKNTALADVGRFQAEAEKASRDAQRSLNASTAALERTKKMRQEQDDADLEAAKGSSEMRSEQEVKERIRRRQAEAELDDTKLERDSANEELSQIKTASVETTKTQTAREIATRLNVDADKLIDAAKFTDGSKEAIEALANLQTKKQEVRPPTKTDSGADSGGGARSFTLAEIDNMSDAEYTQNQGAIEKARLAGKIK
ncbi:hypothetical protein LCGC14_0629530 [marine sediment metagenome]|uniref:Uncharacterized protein n=1 Tax=marine sediment metagenome TaxID=412755 RepID=A0A0F9UAZ5_9ZZZZ